MRREKDIKNQANKSEGIEFSNFQKITEEILKNLDHDQIMKYIKEYIEKTLGETLFKIIKDVINSILNNKDLDLWKHLESLKERALSDLKNFFENITNIVLEVINPIKDFIKQILPNGEFYIKMIENFGESLSQIIRKIILILRNYFGYNAV